MHDALLDAYLATDYRVRLSRGGFATIHIGQALPPPLQLIVGDAGWAFITAWNPGSRARPRAINRVAQHALLAEVKRWGETIAIYAAIGIGRNGWREPSVFVSGPSVERFDALARRHGQLAYVYGAAAGVAGLRRVA